MEAGIEVQEDTIFRLDGVPQKFSHNELSDATEDFSKESILGHGGFGVVYRGELKSGIQVAIKRMNPEATQSQGMKEFKSEVQIISKVKHRNLIELRGYCADGDREEYMLVYDLMPNGSLDDALFKGTVPLSWLQKFKIVTGAADALSYLHQGLNQQVIHRDIKCSNILLDKELNATLGDFGISRMVAHQGRAATTDMAGTLGYIAPEVFSENQFTDKADVYAFGVVILEVACGRRVSPRSSSHDMNLVQWVRFCHDKRNLLCTVDKRYGDGDTKQIRRVLKIGLLCTELNPQARPSMKRVVQILARDIPTKPRLDPSTFMKNLFYRKVPGLVSRMPETVSAGSRVKSSVTGTASKTVSPSLASGSPQTVDVAESSVRSSASGSAFSPGVASRSAQTVSEKLSSIATSTVSSSSALRRRPSVSVEPRELAELENEDEEERKLSVESLAQVTQSSGRWGGLCLLLFFPVIVAQLSGSKVFVVLVYLFIFHNFFISKWAMT